MKLSLVPVSKELQKAPFDCGYPVLNDYLRLYALKNDRLSIGKTFVAVDEGEGVVGYMTLSSAQVEARSLPEAMRAKLPRYPVPAFRIGKLAVDTKFQGQGVGAWLLRQALEKALVVSTEVGLYAVIVDAIDEKAKGFYQKYGFTAFAGYPLMLFLPLATIAKAHS
ncbi:MAG: GNAT family N-acetyltransferase [Treponema sp.]|nr:GNAT family N-acetyltransferase [Treponema sp.]